VTRTPRCAIYARISVTQEQSVAIASQVEAAEQYAASQGWRVVKVVLDDGVSATSNRPEDRAGWSALLASPERFEKVIVWKIDRLARRVLDFLNADATLQARGAGIVSVKEPIDMTSGQGRAFATMLAVFSEMEASAISERVTKARSYLIRHGRVSGGRVPYGFMTVPNPDGKGRVLAQNPETVDYLRGMVTRLQAGATLYGVQQWLDKAGAPLPLVSAKRSAVWNYSTVERIMRNPILGGMILFNPGRRDKTRGGEVLRDTTTGLPVVDETLAVMTPTEWRQMVARLDDRDSAQTRPRTACAKTSALLSGLMRCGHCDGRRLHRGRTQGRESYSCPGCHQTVSTVEDVVIEAFLKAKGEHLRWQVVEVRHEGGAALLPEIENRLDELGDLIRLAPDREKRASLQAEQATLLDLRDEKRGEMPVVTYSQKASDRTFAEDWSAATTVEERRAVLDDALTSITIRRGGGGRRTEAQLLARMAFQWKGGVGALPVPDETWV
jgi:site-specific DNA recombinase